MMLAAVMAKMGTYSFMRFCIPFFPAASRRCAPWIVVLAIIGILYGALVAIVQPNIKRLIAYSSMSHIGFHRAGHFFLHAARHGWRCVPDAEPWRSPRARCFVLVGFLEQRRSRLAIADFGGVATSRPGSPRCSWLPRLASIGLPMLNNFVGEFLVLQGAAQANFTWAVLGRTGRHSFRLLHALDVPARVLWGDSATVASTMPDLNGREWAAWSR